MWLVQHRARLPKNPPSESPSSAPSLPTANVSPFSFFFSPKAFLPQAPGCQLCLLVQPPSSHPFSCLLHSLPLQLISQVSSVLHFHQFSHLQSSKVIRGTGPSNGVPSEDAPLSCVLVRHKQNVLSHSESMAPWNCAGVSNRQGEERFLFRKIFYYLKIIQ